MKPSEQKKSSTHKVLDAPVNLGEMAANAQYTMDDVSSIWVINRDDNLVNIHTHTKKGVCFDFPFFKINLNQ